MIKTSLPDAEVAAEDLKGTGDHYQVAIVSSAFEGLSLVKRHQLVYKAVETAMSSEAIHALSLETHTPAEVATAG
ncbi:MAG: BolA family protein [Phormidesmis sp.]